MWQKVLRGLVATVVAVATFYFVFWVGGAFLLQLAVPSALRAVVSIVVSAAAAALMTKYLLRPPATSHGLGRSVTIGAIVTGGIAFTAGFIGPIIFSPGSNQGPLAGFFLGPIGFVLGGVGGAVVHLWQTPARVWLRWAVAAFVVLIVVVAANVAVTRAPIPRDAMQAGPRDAAMGDSVMVVSASPIASRVGVRVLRNGGNAIDAAVSVAFALAVTYPGAGNIGGGGLMLARMNGEVSALDFREVAPLKATRDMYLDAKGKPTPRSVTGALSVGVPGSVAGLWAAHQKYGKLPWRDVVQPAVDLAAQGFATDAAFMEELLASMPHFPKGTAALFEKQDGLPVMLGDQWANADLARTLRLIAAQGTKGFYEGETAEKFVAQMKRDGGLISLDDLKRYEAKWRPPVEFTYRGFKVLTMPPVSSGGLTIALISNILSGYDLHAMGAGSADAVHVMAEAERLAYLRRNTLLADPDFVTIPAASFLSPDTAAALRASISMARHTPTAVPPDPVAGRHTTHFSVVDTQGNAVSLTTTLNTGYGSGVTVAGAGFLLNNEMDDFTVKPGVINAMGLRQGSANEIVPGKRMLSSMTPTIVLDSAGKTFLVVGAAGGARIITAVAQIISNVIDFRMSVRDAMNAPRFHAQDYPDKIELSLTGVPVVGFPDTVVRALKTRGHLVEQTTDVWGFGWAQAIQKKAGRWYGATEPRGNGLAAGY